jgi:transposase
MHSRWHAGAESQASFHTSDYLRVPDGIHLIEMPPKSPELQPAERLWPLTNEPIANRTFANLDELETVLVERCRVLLKQPELVQGFTHYHWWPDD